MDILLVGEDAPRIVEYGANIRGLRCKYIKIHDWELARETTEEIYRYFTTMIAMALAGTGKIIIEVNAKEQWIKYSREIKKDNNDTSN